ncbi:multicopper oxidase domain-containing protein [Kitasatospora sp. NPDC054939]
MFNRRFVLASVATGALATPLLFAGEAPAKPPERREYWIQADSFRLNLVPNGRDDLSGMAYTPAQSTYWAIGYRAYTRNWGAPLPGNDDIGPNTGVPGPILRGEVGDTLVVHFRNNDQHYRYPHSMHPHGVRYTPENDGAYIAARPQKPGTAVPVGGTYTYAWTCVPSSVGSWVYHDHSEHQMVPTPQGGERMAMELSAQLGLLGMIAVTDRHTPKADREFFVLLHEAWSRDLTELPQDLMLINGAAFPGNTPTFRAKVGEKVRWRVAAMGQFPHVFHIHGHRWHNGRQYLDSEQVSASESLTIEYTEDNPGEWLYHCHYPDHMMMGMAGLYQVAP